MKVEEKMCVCGWAPKSWNFQIIKLSAPKFLLVPEEAQV